MSEDLKPADPVMICGWTKLYHQKGPLVTIPVPCCSDPALMLDYVSRCLDAGFLVTAPGLEAGEEREEIGWVLKGSTQSGDTTAVLYSANEALTWSYLTTYLDTPERVAAFEHASGLKIDAMPEYAGGDKPKRGAAPKSDRFIVQAPKPFGVVWRPNPKYIEAPAGEDTRTNTQKRKRDFVRWADQKPQQATQDAPGATNGPKPKSALQAMLEAKDTAKKAGLTAEGWTALAIEHGAVQTPTGGWNFDALGAKDLNRLTDRLYQFVSEPVQNDSIPW